MKNTDYSTIFSERKAQMNSKKEMYKTQIVSHELVLTKHDLNSDTTSFRDILAEHFASMVTTSIASLQHFPSHDLRITIRIEEESHE